MLLKFDDRLRVVVTSANLYRVDWEMMSNVIWFQDFFTKDSEGSREKTDFEEYLTWFMEEVSPKKIYQTLQN